MSEYEGTRLTRLRDLEEKWDILAALEPKRHRLRDGLCAFTGILVIVLSLIIAKKTLLGVFHGF